MSNPESSFLNVLSIEGYKNEAVRKVVPGEEFRLFTDEALQADLFSPTNDILLTLPGLSPLRFVIQGSIVFYTTKDSINPYSDPNKKPYYGDNKIDITAHSFKDLDVITKDELENADKSKEVLTAEGIEEIFDQLRFQVILPTGETYQSTPHRVQLYFDRF